MFHHKCLFIVVFFSCFVLVKGSETHFVGPRSLGMGGSGTAAVNDDTGQYYNPAVFGFFPQEESDIDNQRLGRKKFGIGVIDLNFGLKLGGELSDHLEDISDLREKIENIQDDNGNLNSGSIASALKALSILDQVADPGNDILASLNAGSSLRIGNFAFGIRSFGNVEASVLKIDYSNLGFDVNTSADLLDKLSKIDSSNTGGGDLLTPDFIKDFAFDESITPTLNSTQFELIRDSITTNLTTDDNGNLVFTDTAQTVIDNQNITEQTFIDALSELDDETRQALEGADFSQEDLDNATVALSKIIADLDDGDTGDLDDNKTTVKLRGFGYVEIPVSYGYAINDNWSVGANIKFMHGRVYGTDVNIFSEDNDEFVDSLEDNFAESSNFGIDIGTIYRIRNFQLGFNARNINSPSFDGFTDKVGSTNKKIIVDDVTLDPQYRVGIAIIPHDTVTLTADYDLIENDSFTGTRETQYLSLGLELNIFRFVALRAGGYQNLADNSDPVITAGLGVNFWLFRLDAAAAISTETIEIDGEDIPREAQASVKLTVNF